jgi:hypothetical protein
MNIEDCWNDTNKAELHFKFSSDLTDDIVHLHFKDHVVNAV